MPRSASPRFAPDLDLAWGEAPLASLRLRGACSSLSRRTARRAPTRRVPPLAEVYVPSSRPNGVAALLARGSQPSCTATTPRTCSPRHHTGFSTGPWGAGAPLFCATSPLPLRLGADAICAGASRASILARTASASAPLRRARRVDASWEQYRVHLVTAGSPRSPRRRVSNCIRCEFGWSDAALGRLAIWRITASPICSIQPTSSSLAATPAWLSSRGGAARPAS